MLRGVVGELLFINADDVAARYDLYNSRRELNSFSDDGAVGQDDPVRQWAA